MEPGWFEVPVFEADTQKTLIFKLECIAPALRGYKVYFCAITRCIFNNRGGMCQNFIESHFFDLSILGFRVR